MVVNPAQYPLYSRAWKVKCNPSDIKDNFTSSSSFPIIVDNTLTMTSLLQFTSISYLVKRGGTNLFGTLPVRLCGNFVSGWKRVEAGRRVPKIL